MPEENLPYLLDPSGQEHSLENPVTRMGRTVENEIVILDKRSSREHAVIRRNGPKLILEDQASKRPTQTPPPPFRPRQQHHPKDSTGQTPIQLYSNDKACDPSLRTVNWLVRFVGETNIVLSM